MKKIIFLLAFILTVSSGFSQKRKRMHKADNMTAEQRTTLAVKKLTLALDLDKNQAKKVTTLYTEMAKKRMKFRKKRKNAKADSDILIAKIKKNSNSKEDFKKQVKKAIKDGKLKKEDFRKMRKRGLSFEEKNKALDHMITLQNKMKKILTKEQYEKFKKMKKHRVKSAKHKMKKHKMAKRVKREHR